MNIKHIRCEFCKHWKQTNFELRIGDCTKFGHRTEACAGINYMVTDGKTIKKIGICEGYERQVHSETI